MTDDEESEAGDASVDAFLREAASAPAEPIETLTGGTLGRYRLLTRLGEGGMGIVYRAHDEKLRRTVALKVLGNSVFADVERRRRFLREARLAAQLAHPNIATIFDVGEVADRVFIAMELVPGKTLRARLDDGPLSEEEVLRIAREVSRGLAKAHAMGIIHRDLKPDNVIVDDDVVKILDFGIAKLRKTATIESGDDPTMSATATEEGRVIGTPAYMSPEQAKGRDVDERSDVFSFGVMLYELVTGKKPFRGETTLEVLIAIDRDDPEPPRSVKPRVSPQLERIILRCLEKKPDDRFASARELSTALAEPTSARRPPWIALLALPLVAGGLFLVARRPSAPEIAPLPPPSAPVVSASEPPPLPQVEPAASTTKSAAPPPDPSPRASMAVPPPRTSAHAAPSVSLAASAKTEPAPPGSASLPPPPKGGFVYDAPF